MVEAGVATGVGSSALSLCNEIGSSGGTACKLRSEPSTKLGRGVAGTVNTEAAREPLVRAFTGKTQLAPREATCSGARATNSPDGASRLSTLFRGPCWRKSGKPDSVSPSKPGDGSEGASQPKATHMAQGAPRSSPCERIRKTRSSSDGLRLLGPLRSSSVAGKGGRDRNDVPLWHLSLIHI